MFINEVLYDYFIARNIYLIPTSLGGDFRFQRLLPDIRAHLLGDKTAYCTTFFDFYGLPEDFPGKTEAKLQMSIAGKADCLLGALTEEFRKELGENPLRRFIPYVQMYEFEALLFSDPTKLASGIGQPDLAKDFQIIRDEFSSPEEINNSRKTAPGKRISRLYRGYVKPLHGSLAAIEIGLEIIRRECRRFDAWLKQIEALAHSTMTHP
jgi:hypothetical protein